VRGALRNGDGAGVAALSRLVAADHAPGERELLARLPEALAAYRTLDAGDRGCCLTVLLTLSRAMLDVLERFPAETAGRIGALETRADLDRYTYMNAGCVGEFWTDMVVAHRPRCAARWNVPLMRECGVRFGQGLQMVNVLRDLPRDLRIGRCYLPRVELASLGVAPEELLDPNALGRVRPLVQALIGQAAGHLREGLSYALAVPRREVRLRLACAWPLLIGLATLARLARADDLLDPDAVVKVPRAEVRRQLALSTALVGSNRALGAYARRLGREVPS
jgi:farnesyl-diphosphate farnesyltransferase